jgi:SAM-dependent methyltransferase
VLDAAMRVGWHVLTGNRYFLRRKQRALLQEFDGKRVLEVGSGKLRGATAFQSAVRLAPLSTEFFMTDVDAALGHDVLDICKPDEKLGRFDLVLCCNVLEHVLDLNAAVCGLSSVCQDDGIVFASTPFIYPYHDEPADFWRPTAHGLKSVFGQHFHDVYVSWTGIRRFPFQLFVRAARPTR